MTESVTSSRPGLEYEEENHYFETPEETAITTEEDTPSWQDLTERFQSTNDTRHIQGITYLKTDRGYEKQDNSDMKVLVQNLSKQLIERTNVTRVIDKVNTLNNVRNRDRDGQIVSPPFKMVP